MSRMFRRALSTTVPTFAGPSRAPTLPLAVRRRREEHPALHRPSPYSEPEKFVGPDAELFPLQLEEEFQTLRREGKYTGEEDDARLRFLKVAAEWQSRVRGGHGRVHAESGEVLPERKIDFLAREGKPRELLPEGDEYHDAVVGQKIFLPNIQIRLMRNHTPPGEAYDPWVATFRIPPSMTKHDLRSYLSAVYGLEVTFIRTDNYIGALQRQMGGQIKHAAGSKKNYKRAVVGLTEPFHYPDDMDEMRAGTWGGFEAGAEQAAERDSVIQDEYALDVAKDYRDAIKMKMNKGFRWRSATHANAGTTIREIMRRRAEREEAIAKAAAEHSAGASSAPPAAPTPA